jgi:archaellin
MATPTGAPQQTVTPTPTKAPGKTATPTPYRRPTATPKPTESGENNVNGSENLAQKNTSTGPRTGIFSKQTVTCDELPGARLTLTTYTKENNLYQVVISGESGGTDFSLSKTSISWTSTDKAAFLKNLPNGTYRLHESGAPAGYSYASDIWFKLVDGVLCDANGVPIPGGSIVMIDQELEEKPESKSESQERPEVNKKANSAVKSPQTSESRPILYIGAFAMLLAMATAVVLLAEKRRNRVRVNAKTGKR